MNPLRHVAQTGRPGDDRCTPAPVWKTGLVALNRVQWDLDPAWNRYATVPARVCWERTMTDGLRARWFGHVFLNPPFSDIAPWIEKIDSEWESKRLDTLTLLVPCDPSTKWWRRCWSRAHAWSAFAKRYHFPLPHHPNGSAPGPINFFYWGLQPEQWTRRLRRLGHATVVL